MLQQPVLGKTDFARELRVLGQTDFLIASSWVSTRPVCVWLSLCPDCIPSDEPGFGLRLYVPLLVVHKLEKRFVAPVVAPLLEMVRRSRSIEIRSTQLFCVDNKERSKSAPPSINTPSNSSCSFSVIPMKSPIASLKNPRRILIILSHRLPLQSLKSSS